MEDTETSPQFKTSSPAVPAPTATHIAALSNSRLQIRCLSSLDVIRSIPLPQSHDLKTSRIAWSPPSSAHAAASTPTPRRTPIPQSNRVLIADDETTRVYDLRDEKWSAVISNGSGGMGKNVHVEFGRNEDEVVVFSDFASRATVWCLKTGRAVEVRDQKFVGREGRGWGYRPGMSIDRRRGEGGEGRRGGVMAILCRSAGQDVMLLLAPGTYEVLKRVELPTTDAAGLKWSRDGRWIAVWDSAAAGYHMHIYTADGHLYRTITREPSEESMEWAIEGLGIKSVEWVPGDQWLAVGGWDRRVRILSTRTFSPVVFLDHTAQVHVPSASVYTEHIDGTGARSYVPTQQPVTPPKTASEKGDSSMKQGISIIAFNKDGTLCATRDDSTPTTVWIWDLRSLRPKTILIQHAPVKSLSWHPSNPSNLLIQAVHDSPTVYLYTTPLSSLSQSRTSSTSTSTSMLAGPPLVLPLSDTIARPAGSAPLKWDAKWLTTPDDKKPAFLFGHQQGYEVVWPQGKDQILRFDDGDAEQSDDSLYDILTGRTPVPKLRERERGGGGGGDDDDDDDDDEMDEDEGDSENFVGVDVDGLDEIDGMQETEAQGERYQESTGSFEDTFREKRKGNVGASGTTAPRTRAWRKEVQVQAFDESGLDEMF